MGSVKKNRISSKNKNRARESRVELYLIVIIPITLIFCLVFYLIIQGVMERLGLSPIIFLTPSSWMSSGEAVLMFLLWLGVSIALGSILAYLLIRKLAE